MEGAAGNDTVNGGDGADTLFGGNDDDNVGGGAGADSMFGGSGNDNMDGGDGADTIFGETGADTIHGGSDNDTIDGNSGADQLFGDNGDDLLTGGTTGDTLSGGNGNDTLNGGTGDDVLEGGLDEDTFTFQTSGGNMLDGSDTITDIGSEIVIGITTNFLEFNDALYAGPALHGDDAAAYMDGLAGVTVVQGGGNTTINWANAATTQLNGVEDLGVFGPIDSFADLEAFGVFLVVT
jgi:hypothetical protein